MAFVTAQFLVNNLTGKEQFVVNLPSSYEFAAGEVLHERQITEEEYNYLILDNGNNIKLYRFIDYLSIYDLTKPPKGIDYKIGLNTRLFTDPFIRPDGFLTKMDYYAHGTYNATAMKWDFTDLVLTSTFDYTIDPTTKFVFTRNKTITWYKEDGTAHSDQKIMFKNYSPIEMDDEAIQRRKNVIALMKLEIAMFIAKMVAVQYPNPGTRPDSNNVAKAFIAPLNIPIMNYINGGDLTLRAIILASNDPMMNTVMPQHGKTVKMFIADRLN